MADSQRSPTRRGVLAAGAAALAAPLAQAQSTSPAAPKPRLRYCLNTSTLRGQKLPLTQLVDITAQAGYDAIEPWMGEIEAHLQAGGTLADLRQRIKDAGLTVESAIGFAQWIVNDDAARARGLEHARRDMDRLAAIGGTRIAAPPAGAQQSDDIPLAAAAERYHALLELGRQAGVTPQLELWGFSRTLSRLGEIAYVAVEAAHPDACLLLDIYHIYKGGSDFAGLRMLSGAASHVLHMNDYPADPPRDRIADRDRVYPGEGIAPIRQILNDLFATGFSGVLSLELFNEDYWKQDALEVAKRGLERTRGVVG